MDIFLASFPYQVCRKICLFDLWKEQLWLQDCFLFECIDLLLVAFYFPTSYQYLIIRRGQNAPHKAFAGLLYTKFVIAFNFNPSLLQECKWKSIMKSTHMSPASFSIMLPFAKVQQKLIFVGKAHTYLQGSRSWQPFGEGKNGHKDFRRACVCYFPNKCVVFACNCKLI